jgi:branched-chain amino acid transport system permease protein
MDVNWDLLINAVVTGVVLGGFYASVAIGVTIAFGMLDIVNIAHPAFIIVGGYLAFYGRDLLGFDPLVSILVFAPFGYLIGRVFYRGYHHFFESRGDESLQGLAFFFGVLFIVEIGVVLVSGVDYRSVEAAYLESSLSAGFVSVPWRMLAPFFISLGMLGGIQLFLLKTFTGRTILAVAQDFEAVRLIGADPIRAKEIAFGIAVGTAIVAGVLLIIIQPIEPSIAREYIGRAFAICVLGGIASIPGTLVASLVLGVAESMTTTFYGPSWSPAVAFGLLLLTLTFKPSGLFGR